LLGTLSCAPEADDKLISEPTACSTDERSLCNTQRSTSATAHWWKLINGPMASVLGLCEERTQVIGPEAFAEALTFGNPRGTP
jgi:predicted Fe-S protein YdhL (DUF1289 family)